MPYLWKQFRDKFSTRLYLTILRGREIGASILTEEVSTKYASPQAHGSNMDTFVDNMNFQYVEFNSG